MYHSTILFLKQTCPTMCTTRYTCHTHSYSVKINFITSQLSHVVSPPTTYTDQKELTAHRVPTCSSQGMSHLCIHRTQITHSTHKNHNPWYISKVQRIKITGFLLHFENHYTTNAQIEQNYQRHHCSHVII